MGISLSNISHLFCNSCLKDNTVRNCPTCNQPINYIKKLLKSTYNLNWRLNSIENQSLENSNYLKDEQLRIKSFVGQTYDGEKFGMGKAVYFNGDIYEGTFAFDEKAGLGKYLFQDGEVYEGEWQNDLKHGRGKYTALQGYYYEGEFKNDFPNGNGEFNFEKREYKGECIGNDNGIMASGEGEYKYKGIGTCKGNFLNDKPHGYCEFVYETGDTYSGYFDEGKKSGQGTYANIANTIYEGEWKNNLFDGLGKINFHNGDSFIGNFSEGKRCGEGIYMKKFEDIVFEGLWISDELIFNEESLKIFTGKNFTKKNEKNGFYDDQIRNEMEIELLSLSRLAFLNTKRSVYKWERVQNKITEFIFTDEKGNKIKSKLMEY